MSADNGRRMDTVEQLEARSSAWRMQRRSLSPRWFGRRLWAVVVMAAVASTAAVLMGLEPSPVNYGATLMLLASMGLLAVLAALNVDLRYQETILQAEDVERSFRSLRQVVTTAMDERDSVTGGHSDRVVELSMALGRRLSLEGGRLRHLEWAAFLHDIGKVRVDEEILRKPGPLDAAEWGEMQQHPYFSYSILAQVDLLRDAAEIVYCHHERYDGMGYPRRLSGADIPLEARIFSVADAYDAMVSPRPYRPSMGHETAVREIIGHAGSQFDPRVVAAFAEWAVSVGGGPTEEIVAEEMKRLPAELQLHRPHWV